jgi:hypothetical protein
MADVNTFPTVLFTSTAFGIQWDYNVALDNVSDPLDVYILEVWDAEGLEVKGTYTITPDGDKNGIFTLSFAENTSIFGSVARKFLVKIYSKCVSTNLSPPMQLYGENVVPAAPITISISTSSGYHYISITPGIDTDIAGYILYRSTTQGFIPSVANKVYDDVGSYITLATTDDTLYYYRAEIYDSFGKSGLNMSTEYTARTPPVSPKITAITNLTWAADKLMYLTGTESVASIDFLSWVRTFISAGSKVLGFDSISPLSAKGDLILFDGTNNIRLPVGTDGKYLKAKVSETSGVIWEAISGADVPFSKSATWISASALTNTVNQVPIYIPKACTLTKVIIITEGGTGSCSIDIWKDVTANFPPTVEDSICGGDLPAIASGTYSIKTSFSSWSTTSLAEGDILMFSLVSTSVFTFISLILTFQ